MENVQLVLGHLIALSNCQLIIVAVIKNFRNRRFFSGKTKREHMLSCAHPQGVDCILKFSRIVGVPYPLGSQVPTVSSDWAKPFLTKAAHIH